METKNKESKNNKIDHNLLVKKSIKTNKVEQQLLVTRLVIDQKSNKLIRETGFSLNDLGI